MPKCTFLVGVPGSGKTTWLNKQWFNLFDCTVLSSDEVIQVTADRWGLTYNGAFPLLIKFANEVFKEELIKASNRGHDIFIDRTNLTKASRARIMRLLPSEYEFEALVFPVPEDLDKRLASRPGKHISSDVMNRMLASYEEPSYRENFSKITFMP